MMIVQIEFSFSPFVHIYIINASLSFLGGLFAVVTSFGFCWLLSVIEVLQLEDFLWICWLQLTKQL